MDARQRTERANAQPTACLTQDQALARLKQNQRARRRGNPETPIVKACLDLLILMGIEAWRENTVSMGINYQTKSGENRRRFIHAGRVGKSDILGILRGRFLAIEVKVPGEQPTPEQWEFLRRVEAEGGVAIVAHSASEMKRRIDEVIDALSPSASITARARQFVARMPRFVAIIDREAHQAVQRLFEEAMTQ